MALTSAGGAPEASNLRNSPSPIVTFCSSVFPVAESWVVAGETSKESRGDLGFFKALKSTPGISEEDFEDSSSFSSSITFSGFFRSAFFGLRRFFFFLACLSSEGEEDSSVSYPEPTASFFFPFGISESDSESDSDSDELKSLLCLFFFDFF